MIDIITILIISFFVTGFGLGLVWSYADKCNYCGKLIMIKRANIRIPFEYGFVFIPYHRRCYMKYKQVKENKIVS